MAKKLKNSEPFVWDYLQELQGSLDVRYEVLSGNKRPDFSAWDHRGIRATWEVTDRDHSTQAKDDEYAERLIREGVMIVKDAPALEMLKRKIKKKSEQLSSASQHPNMLVFAVWRGEAVLYPHLIARVLNDRSHEHWRFNDHTENQSISALSILRIAQVGIFEHDLDSILDRNAKTMDECLHAVDLFLKAYELIRHQDPWKPRLDIILNPRALSPWPVGLWGRHDRVFLPTADGLELLYDGLSPATLRSA
ncbi:MAG: hypothetical protein JNJ45_05175 [Chthonomonas sp.]|nr:hypothetical protein [Chthonomonas sp.]